MSRFRSRKNLPPAEPGEPGNPNANGYLRGYFSGLLIVASSMLVGDMDSTGGGFVQLAIGIHSVVWTYLILLVLLVLSIAPLGVVTKQYHDITGRLFAEDQIGFVKAGGRDIVVISGLLAIAASISLFAMAIPDSIPSWIRIPAIALLSIVLGSVLGSVISRWAFGRFFSMAMRNPVEH